MRDQVNAAEPRAGDPLAALEVAGGVTARNGWGACPGCGRERRTVRRGRVMCEHNRWDSLTWAMVPCDGSSRPPHPAASTATGREPAGLGVSPAGDGRAA